MSRRTQWAISVFWLFVGFAYMMSFYVDSLRFGTKFNLSIGMVVLFETVYVSWAGLTFFLHHLLRRPIVKADFAAIATIFLVGMIIWQPLIALVDTTITSLVFDRPLSMVVEHTRQIRSTAFFFNGVLYVVVFATCAGLIFQQHSEETKLSALELERKHTQAELSLTNMRFRSLQNQLSPHFLFNALNAISGLARRDGRDDIVGAVARLGDLLRYALQASDRSFVSVKEEVNFTLNYVGLQKLRFGRLYAFELDYDQALDVFECPPFALQALVENAFTHEVSRQRSHVAILARVERVGDRLTVIVANTTTVPPTSATATLGLALGNLKERLDILYGEEARLCHGYRDGQYVAQVSFPIEAIERDA